MFGPHLQIPTLENASASCHSQKPGSAEIKISWLLEIVPKGGDPEGHLPVAHFILPSSQGTWYDVPMFTNRETEAHKQRNSAPH